MTDGVAGYRTLAQIGAMTSAPVPAGTDARVYLETPPIHPLTTPPFKPVTSTARAPIADAREAADRDRSPFSLPSPERILREGGRHLIEFHPRDPNLRVTGRHRQPPPEAEGQDGGAASGAERSGFAKKAMIVGIGGGFVMNGVDILRTVKKYPEALRAARFDPSLGRMGRMPTALALTAMTRPDARLIDPTAPRMASVASRGMSFTKFDEIAMKSSVALATSLAGLQIATAIPNLADALSKDGPWYENLAMTTSGRAGVLQLSGGTLGLGLFATALHQTSGTAGPSVIDKVMAAAKAPVMAKPIFTTIGLASGALVMANELGYMDSFNTGETRPVGTVLKDAAHRTPVLNDQELRTAALLAAAGVVGYKSSRAIQAAGGLAGGGLAGLGKGHIIGGAIVAGLLGAQLLGGLSGLNKAADS